jgi:hypothetical protein
MSLYPTFESTWVYLENLKKCFLRLFPHLLIPLLGLLSQVGQEAGLKPVKKSFKNQIFRISR